MKLAEQHVIKPSDPRYAAIDAAAFASKNLYNQVTYQMRQAFINDGIFLSYAEIFHLLKHFDCYQALPRKVSNSLLILIDKNWKLAAVTSNKHGFTPRLVSGKPIKSSNQYYNKQRAHLQSRLSKESSKRFTSRQLDQITTKRNRRIASYLHTASRRIIDLLVSEGIGRLIIGKNPLWKQDINLGKKNNQGFVQMPHAHFIEMLQYKGALVGIEVIVHEECYTSKASFLDLDDIPTYDPQRTQKPTFSGKRIARSWYRAANGQVIHADINGSYNILRKVAPTAFHGLGVVGAAVRPRRLAV